MLKKKILAVLFVTIMLLGILTACSGKADDDKYYGDEMTKDTLRICVDSNFADQESSVDQEYANRKYFQGLAEEIKLECGIEKIVFEILPQEGTKRETRLQRLRTEIMSGSGPDLFIMQTVTASGDGMFYKPALFNFPEKNMESGLFLPLDTYMENNTRFTDWGAQTKVVLDAGRNEEGQLIIPLTYTFPVLIYPKNEADIPYTTDLTRREILDNPETAKVGAALYTVLGEINDSGGRYANFSAVTAALGDHADYKNEELLFSEDELYEIANEAFMLMNVMDRHEWQYISTEAGYWRLIYELYNCYYDEEMTLVPKYSQNGGVTATITAYAAVNRNTRFPKESFAVIDYLMQEKMQRGSDFYSYYFIDGISLQNDLGSEEKTLGAQQHIARFLSEPHFKEFLAIKEQITAVNFKDELDVVMDKMLSTLVLANDGDSEISREMVSEAYNQMKRMVRE